ncbi:MAG: TIGR02147 family protein [Fibrobacteres bacterium]|nr:TIGR02147 family protein [Fibrobacterota bacterium]
MVRPELHDYTDFRIYLRDVLAWHRRRGDESFLQRELLKRLGVASTGFISNLVAGRKNLTPTQIRRFAEILEFSESDALYFDALVHFGQSKDQSQRQEWLERLSQLRTVALETLAPKGMSMFSHSEAVFLYEYLTISEFDGDFERLGAAFDPPVSGDRIREALAVLESSGLVERDEKDRLRVCSTAVSSGPSPSSQDLANFHRRTMALARRSLSQTPQPERDLSVLTLGLSDDGFRRIRSEIAHFRRRLVAIALEETRADRVFQLNFHLFPVTRTLEEVV